MTSKAATGSAPDPERLAAARAVLAAAVASDTSLGQTPLDDTSTGDRAGDDDLVSGAAGDLGVPGVPRRKLKAVENMNVGLPSVDGASGPGVAEARQIALRQLAMGPRSRHQLTEKMTARGCQPEDITSVLDRMTDVGLVDDAAYAEMLVRTKREGPGLAAVALRHELRKKGVPQHIAEHAVTAVSTDDERSRAQDLVNVRLRRMVGLDRDVQMRRLAGFLSRKGYPSGLTLSVVRAAVDGLPEHRRD